MLGPDLESLFCFCGQTSNRIKVHKGDGDEEQDDDEEHDDDQNEDEQESKHFSLKTICMLGIEMFTRIEYIHSKGFLHRDIKPQNFLMGVGKKANMVYCIDFGLAKRYIDPKSGNHIPYKEKSTMAGTVRYLSMNANLGREQSRRDDLESIVFVIAYFLRKGILPWMGIKVKRKDKTAA